MKLLIETPDDLKPTQMASAFMDITKALLFFAENEDLLQIDGSLRVETDFGPCFVHLEEDENILDFPTQ